MSSSTECILYLGSIFDMVIINYAIPLYFA
jgi:hypothetical protein